MSDQAKKQSLVLRFIKEFLVYRKYTAIAVMTIILGTIVSLYPPYILGIAIDEYLIVGRVEGFLALSLMYLALILIQWLVQMVRGYTIELIGQKMVYSLRMRLFSKLLQTKIGFYKDKYVGDIVSRIVNDTTTIVDVFVSGLLNIIGDIITIIGVFIIMFTLSQILTLASMISIPPLIFISMYLGAKMRLAHRSVRGRIGGLTSIVEETYSGIDAIKSFNREKAFIGKFINESMNTMKASIQAAVLSGLYWSSTGFVSTLSSIAVLLVGGYLVFIEMISIGTVIAFTQYVGRFMGPINNIAGMYDRLQQALASLERVYEILDFPEVEEDKGIELKKLKGEVVFDDVWFEYEKGVPVLKNVNFHIRSGELAAIVGPTGAGKTTIVNLLLKFYEPTSGRILIDGINIKEIKRSCLRNRISYVPQEVYLFPGTILDNIRIGKPDATDKEVIEVCRKLGIHEFIEKLPKGYYADAGEAGKRLSVGERQLIAIARAMLRDPDIVILDEATSSIDPYTDELLRNAIKNLMVGRTGIIIAHRLATARSCDRVVVVNEGVVGEVGTFDELLNKKGIFYKLYQAQMSRTIELEYGYQYAGL
ncbi:MAG: ABC transporter ATP-binding protein [Ignisphaera sp.]|uniref:ABC transporter ATP-binding protein n=1 Tax=Ignisphaera aggregans TaxID=334771 RepID=A0A7C4NLB6_9CREN